MEQDTLKVLQEIEQLFSGDFIQNLRSAERFSKYSQIYSFATENIAGYFPKLGLNGKRVLTVSGSGDHIINAYLYGARKVDSFDINMLSSAITDLKIKANKKLSLSEFKDFFFRRSNALDFSIYSGLRSQLSNKNKFFFDKAYQYFEKDGFAMRESELFNNRYDERQLKIMNNPYLQSEMAYKLAAFQLQGKQSKWICSSVEDLESRLNVEQEFDVVLLSNISDYAKTMFSGQQDYLQIFCDRVIVPLEQHLSSEGIICAAYIYDARKEQSSNEQYRSTIDDPGLRREIFESAGMKYKEVTFNSVIPEKKDAVVILQGRNGG